MDVERSVAAVPFDHALLHAVHATARRQRRTLHSIRADRGVVPRSGSTDQPSASAKSKGARTGVRGTACRIFGGVVPVTEAGLRHRKSCSVSEGAPVHTSPSAKRITLSEGA